MPSTKINLTGSKIYDDVPNSFYRKKLTITIGVFTHTYYLCGYAVYTYNLLKNSHKIPTLLLYVPNIFDNKAHIFLQAFKVRIST